MRERKPLPLHVTLPFTAKIRHQNTLLAPVQKSLTFYCSVPPPLPLSLCLCNPLLSFCFCLTECQTILSQSSQWNPHKIPHSIGSTITSFNFLPHPLQHWHMPHLLPQSHRTQAHHHSPKLRMTKIPMLGARQVTGLETKNGVLG